MNSFSKLAYIIFSIAIISCKKECKDSGDCIEANCESGLTDLTYDIACFDSLDNTKLYPTTLCNSILYKVNFKNKIIKDFRMQFLGFSLENDSIRTGVIFKFVDSLNIASEIKINFENFKCDTLLLPDSQKKGGIFFVDITKFKIRIYFYGKYNDEAFLEDPRGSNGAYKCTDNLRININKIDPKRVKLKTNTSYFPIKGLSISLYKL